MPFFTGAFIYANNEPKSALARDLGDCRDVLAHSHRNQIMQSSHKNRRAWRLRSESETLDTSLQNPFHICDRDPVICHRDLLVGGIP